MKKRFQFVIALLFVGLFACEKDDFCTLTPVTPNLVLRFYDKTDTTKTKIVNPLSIIAQGKTDSLFTGIATDSIAIPLNGFAFETVYTLKKHDTLASGQIENITSEITIRYTPEEEYISRSCGYRFIFKQITIENSTNSWIDRFTILQDSIINQAQAHVQVFY